MSSLCSNLTINIYADGADMEDIVSLAQNPLVKGFTTNPTLMRKAGIKDYEKFARKILEVITEHPISFEVFADEFDEMERQALKIASWGENVNVKVPITNTKGEVSSDLIRRLSHQGVVLNVTAIMTHDQVRQVAHAASRSTSIIVSVFAGRIADTGIDPIPHMRFAKTLLSDLPHAKLLWASPRELINIFQANEIGCDIITVTNDLLAKLALVGKSLRQYSLETVSMFHSDAVIAGYTL
jgi:transaldolase